MQLELVGRIQRRPTGIVTDHLYFEMRGGEILASKVILADVTCDRREHSLQYRRLTANKNTWMSLRYKKPELDVAHRTLARITDYK